MIRQYQPNNLNLDMNELILASRKSKTNLRNEEERRTEKNTPFLFVLLELKQPQSHCIFLP